MPTLRQLQQRYDDREPVEGDECDLGMVPCSRCGRTGVDPLAGRVMDPWESDACRECSGDGMVSCPGCGECGKGESEVFDV